MQGTHSPKRTFNISICDFCGIDFGKCFALDVFVGKYGSIWSYLGNQDESWRGRSTDLSGVRHEGGVIELAAHRKPPATVGVCPQPKLTPHCRDDSGTFEVSVQHDEPESGTGGCRGVICPPA